MGFEYRLSFADPDWLTKNRQRVAEKIRTLRSFRDEIPPHEFRLKDTGTANPWPYDVRLFLTDKPAIEVSIATESFFVDVRALVNWIRGETAVQVVDDDGEPIAM